MVKTIGRILKGRDVTLQGSLRLDVESLQMSPTTKTGAPAGTPHARIISTDPQFVIIELVCSCGAKTHLKCNYDNQTPQNATPEIVDQSLPQMK
jgi:hypothetical protein